MLKKHDRQGLLKDFFDHHQSANMKQLSKSLKTSSRVTVFRTLKALGYLTSYSHAGSYYTLEHIPRFDAHGLWFWRDVGFSKYGTLRETIIAKVKEAAEGCTHEELQALLQIRVQNTLLDLVESKLIKRCEVDSIFVYVDNVATKAKAQLAKRRKSTCPHPSATNDTADVVKILLIVINRHTTDAKKIATILRTQGVKLSDDDVTGVLTEHGLLKKKKKSRLRR